MPLPPPARSGCHAAQHRLLDGADDALREVGVAPGHLLLDVPEILQLLELPVLQRLRGHFLGQRIDGHQHEGVWLALEGLHVGTVQKRCARASRPGGRGGRVAGPAGAEEPIRNVADARRRTIKPSKDPRTGFGSIAQTLQ